MKISNYFIRSTHRDLGYFFFGLIISFSLSGILLNHREDWDAGKYTYDFKRVDTSFRLPLDSVTKKAVDEFSKIYKLKNFRDFHVREDSVLEIFYKNANVEVQLATGKAEISLLKKTPVFSQTIFLHRITRNAWIWYSDIFGIGMLVIAITGMCMNKGKYGFCWRGLILSLVGIVFPLIILIAFS